MPPQIAASFLVPLFNERNHCASISSDLFRRSDRTICSLYFFVKYMLAFSDHITEQGPNIQNQDVQAVELAAVLVSHQPIRRPVGRRCRCFQYRPFWLVWCKLGNWAAGRWKRGRGGRPREEKARRKGEVLLLWSKVKQLQINKVDEKSNNKEWQELRISNRRQFGGR